MRWILTVVAGLAALALAAVLAVVLMPSEQIAETLAKRIEAQTGNDVEISDVRATLWPEPSIVATQVQMSSPASTKPLLQASEIRVTVDAEAFWGGEVRVRSIAMTSPVIRLHRNEDGRPNWDFARASAEAGVPEETSETSGGGDGAAGAALPGLLFEEAAITGGIVDYEDETTGQPGWSARGVDLTVRRGAGGVVEITGDMEVAAAPMQFTIEVADIGAALAGRASAVRLDAASGQSTARFAGRAGFAPVAAEGRIEAALVEPAALFRRLGVAMADLPEGLGRDSLTVTGDLTYTAEKSLHLRDGRLAADGQAFAGAFDLTQGAERPMLTADLSAGTLTLPGSPEGGGTGEGGGAERAGDGWPTERIDVSGLGAIDAKVRLRAERVEAGGAVLAPVSLAMTLDRSRAVFDIARMGAFGGTLAGQLVVNGRGGLSVRSDMTATGVSLAPFLGAVLGYDRLTGTGTLTLNVLGVGNSVSEIAQSLEGEGSILLTDGVLEGVDLPGMLRFLDAERVGTETETRYDRVSGTFGIAGGVLANDDLRIEAPLAVADGRGVVGIGERVIDYRLVPVALPEADGTGGRKVPLRITGTWADPKFRLDIEAAAEAELREREEALKAEAEARAVEELGIEPREGESLEDAARRRLEEELIDGLGDLLGGE